MSRLAPRTDDGATHLFREDAHSVVEIVRAGDRHEVRSTRRTPRSYAIATACVTSRAGLIATLANFAIRSRMLGSAWVAAQRTHAAEAARVEAAVDAVAKSVGEVATGLSGLRAEVASLREDLSSHADATDRGDRGL
ncbi:MAG: hypothetical protein E6Q97_37810 [Desulfurellales bacterium]|nr:MAG: hypothetical protein E6Q97_37810 [Desulfurellales bacterium]